MPTVRLLPFLYLFSACAPAPLAQGAMGPLSLSPDEASERIAAIQRHITDNTADADRWAELAWLLYRYGQDTPGAMQAAERACQIDGDHFKAREIAGRLKFLSGDEDRAFDHWQHLLEHNRPEAQMYISALTSLAETGAQRHAVREKLQQVADRHPNHLFQTIAKRHLSDFALAEGRIDEAETILEKMGTIDQWWVIGPFANERHAGYNRTYGPETEIDLDQSYQGRSRHVSWRRLRHLTFERFVDFSSVMFPRENVLVYALTYIKTPESRNATLRLGACEAFKVWFNDREVFASDEDRGFSADQVTIPIRLESGANKLLVKLGVEQGPWRLAVRLTDPPGEPFNDVTFRLDTPSTPNQADESIPVFDFTPTMIDHFERIAQSEPDNEDALYYLGIAQQSALLGTRASKTFERLVTQNPRCADHRRLAARAYLGDDKAEKAFAELKIGIELDPNNLQLRLMLARFYHARRLFKKERECLEQIQSLRPDWRTLRFQRVENFIGEGWEELAFREIQSLYEADPSNLRATAMYARACAGRGYTEDYHRLLSEIIASDFANPFARRERLRRAITDQHFDDAFQMYDVMHRLDPLAYGLRIERARLLASLKRFDEAIDQCKMALAICEDDFAIHREMGLFQQRKGDDVAALASFRTALENDPADGWLRDYVDYLQPEQHPIIEQYALGDESVKTLLAKTVTPAQYPRSDSVYLLDEMVVELSEDGSTAYQVHQIAKVLDESGRDQWTRVNLPPGTNRVERAVVIQPDGSEVEATQITNSSIHFTQLRPGSIVQYRVRGYAPANDWMSRQYSESFYFQTNDPMIRSRFIVVAPIAKPIRQWYQGQWVQYRQEPSNAGIVHIWEARDVPRLQPEPNRPPALDVCAQVRVSTIDDWDKIARWEHSLIKEQFEPDHDLLARVDALTSKKHSTREKIRAIANFVSQDIQYKILRGGIFGYKPNKAANVLHNEWGDCKDKATLLITMLKSVGIEAQYATLRTRSAGQLIKEIPSNQCNHAIVYIPSTGDVANDLWLDGTALEHGTNTLPWEDQGVWAMVWDEGGAMRFERTPIAPADETINAMSFVVQLSPDGSATIDGEWRTTGQIAAGMRVAFKQAGTRSERLTQTLNGFVPGSELQASEFSDLTDREAPVKIAMRFSAAGYARVEGRTLTCRFKRPFQTTAQFAPQDVRYSDVWLPYCQTQEFIGHYELPKGYDVVSVPSPIDLNTPWMTYTTEVTRTDREVSVARRLQLNAVVIPKDRYDELRDFCIRLDEYEAGATVVLRKRG